MDATTVLAFRTGALGTWREKVGGMASFARAAGWRLQQIDAREAKPDAAGLVEFWGAKGAIVDASGQPELFSPSDFGSVPVVWMNPGDEPAAGQKPHRNFVASDSEEITRIAAAELLGSSPASLVFVEWPKPWRWSVVKREIMRKLAAMHAIPFSVVTPAEQELADAAALQSRIAGTLGEVRLPCAVFAATDLLGAAAVAAAARIGRSVPDDIAVASVDDDPEICESCTPALTSVRPNFHRLGFAAGRLLRKAMDAAGRGGRTAAECEVVPPLGLVRRASTLSLRRHDHKASEALELIRREACGGLRPGDAAAVFGTSRRSAEVRFKAATGKTMGEAILERRLAAACDHLRAGGSSVSAIANFCGWNGDLAFRKAFKARFGVPPLAWSRRQRASSSRHDNWSKRQCQETY